jgi:hypothetical protein
LSAGRHPAFGAATTATARAAIARASGSPSASAAAAGDALGPPGVEHVEPRHAPEPRSGRRLGAVGRERRLVGRPLGRRGVADQEEIVPGRGGAHGGLADRAERADRAHLEVVRHDDAAVAHLAAEVVLHDFENVAGGGRIESGQSGCEVMMQSTPASIAAERGRWSACMSAQSESITVGPVRIHRGVPLAGEVAQAEMPARMPRMRAAPRRPTRAGADADVRAIALGEHVEARAEVDVHAELPQLAPPQPRRATIASSLAGPREGVVREDGDAPAGA